MSILMTLFLVLILSFGASLPAQQAPEATSQDPTYFVERAPPSRWVPEGHLLVTAERIPAVPDPEGAPVDRIRTLLDLGWKASWGMARGELILRSGLGTDGNASNVLRYDQQPSNGVWLQRASITFPMLRERWFGELVLGLQGNPLLAQESLWDHDLALTGLGFRAAYRDEAGGLQEAGIRAVSGRVRTFPGSGVDLIAVQAVLRVEVGDWGWTAHAGRWELAWDLGMHRLKSALESNQQARQRLRLDEIGLGVQVETSLPWECRGVYHRNPATGEAGGEYQLWLGARARLWRPQFGFVWQQFDFAGTFMPVNGDEWWFTRAARGPRYVVLLSLPQRWRLSLGYLRHRQDSGETPVARTTISAHWQF